MTRKITRKRKRPVTAKRSAQRGAGPRGPASRIRSLPWRYILAGIAVLCVAYVVYLDVVVRGQFESKRWASPAKVYARPLELYVGLPLRTNALERELNLLNYAYAYRPQQAGSFQRNGNRFDIVTRDFTFWDAFEAGRQFSLVIADGVITQITDATGKDVPLARLDPVVIGGIYPAHKEDRLLVQLNEVPPQLVQMLIAVEDRKFESHYGIDVKAIARALWANLRAGAAVQGGSTLTQQLVKNFYLDNRRTLWRKANEAVMAILLELHYTKAEILEAYINEVYLGQDGSRAIHGFGLASRFYFNKPLDKLNLNEMSILVALVRGPSYYHPERNKERLVQRRDLILDLLLEQQVINPQQARATKATGIQVNTRRHAATSRHPAFLELVGRQLREYYQQDDLTSTGLRIFTTLDPILQADVEEAARRRVAQLDKQRQLHGALQAAAIVANVTSGEIQALVSDSNPQAAGFNRALDASRPIGSLIKPFVFLAALEQSETYNWLSLIDDSAITLQAQNGETWSPRNYDNQSHGEVPLISALANSYNQATVRLGMQVGFPAINRTVQRLGLERELPPYPAILLGATDMTPLTVLQMYQTLAAQGFHSPLRAIRDVLDASGQPLRRYPIQVQQTFNASLVQVLNSGLVQVVNQGTARALGNMLPAGYQVAGKTGTTDDSRDSWFAGFSASHVAVVWMGVDDNQPTGLSGSSGAMLLWGDVFARMPTASLHFDSSDELEVHWVDIQQRLLTDAGCQGSMQLAFLPGTAPAEAVDCTTGVRSRIDKTVDWFRSLFD